MVSNLFASSVDEQYESPRLLVENVNYVSRTQLKKIGCNDDQ